MGDEEKQQPRVLQMVQAEGSDKTCITFVLNNEDHTLGNSLRYMIMKNPEVEFCGYSITHPSERKINFRIQTRGGLPAIDAFQKGLEDLTGICQHILNMFEASVEEYKAMKDVTMQYILRSTWYGSSHTLSQLQELCKMVFLRILLR
uniref:DNA-directed RNA polymerases I and III subunit RPAC2 n=2 Tax=Naja naja TaxID=35670 RepID=A0A8C6XLP0_NAJNA